MTNTKASVRDKKAGNAYSAAGDDDINDVAAMGGVNLAEESQRMATDSFLTSSALQSCGKDEVMKESVAIR